MHIVVIGGNAAGMSAAAKLRRGLSQDDRITVFEQSGETSYGACGLPYYISGLNTEADRLRIRKPEAFIRSGIDVRLFHQVTRIDPGTRTVHAQDLKTGALIAETYDKLIIATGSTPVRPDLPGIGLGSIFTLKTIEEAENIRQAALAATVEHIVIMGAGYIGLELAESFALLQKKVRIIEMAERPMLVMDPEFSIRIAETLAAHQVELLTQERVVAFEGQGQVAQVVTDQGRYPADLVVVSVGTRPNTAFLQDLGLERLGNGAIVVDEQMRTSIPDIYAAGDCATIQNKLTHLPVYLPLGTNANKQGKILAEILLGQDKKLAGVLGTSMCRVLDLELARTGLNEAEAAQAGLNCSFVIAEAPNKPPYYPDNSKLLIKLFYETDSHVMLGAQICGREGAALRIATCATAIDAQMTVEQFAVADLGYAPPFTYVWDPVQIVAGLVR